MEVYQQALELRPNYVRTIANIGLGYNSIGRYEEAMPYFLNALVLNPSAKGIWKYFRRSCNLGNRDDLLEKSFTEDANNFRD